MLGKAEFVGFLRGVDNAMGALLQSRFELVSVSSMSYRPQCRPYQRNSIRWLCLQLVRQFFVVGYQVRNVNIAVVLLYQHVLSDMISIRTDSVRDASSTSGSSTCR